MRLTTARLLLRDFEAADLSAPLAALPTTPGLALQPFDLRAPDAVRAQIREALAGNAEEPRTRHELAVTLRVDGRLIGRAGFKRSAHERRDAMFWFVSDPASWNQGYVSEAAPALFAAGFDELGLHRIYAECDPSNAEAVKLMETLGLRREGNLIENAWHDGQWRDTALYALLDREWQARKA